MKLRLEFELLTERLDNDYRFGILSFFKSILSEKYPDYFTSLYARTEMKGFTFSVYLPRASIQAEYTTVPSLLMSVTVSGINQEFIMRLYNSAVNARGKTYPMKLGQRIKLNKCTIMSSKVLMQNTLAIKFLSPLLVRVHTADNKDRFLSFKDEEFTQSINTSLTRLRRDIGYDPMHKEIALRPLQKASVTVIRSDGLKFQSNIGEYILTGDIIDLNLLYQAGMGSKCSVGFGMFEAVEVLHES
ncbi:MAG: CRISPR-associated endoribonuclease Cas6 [Clostridia bacterium]|nr:CRISPR-associated endoribonuclease Cas6 [Clostridia bacterium]